jgi:Xaa-Pro aminopeptidase
VLHFSREELASRVARARRAVADEGLDALLLFAQESLYYLTGYDTNGYVFFQCAVLTADEAPITLLTRRPDLLSARLTSTIEDVRIWYDAPGGDPAQDLKAILEERGLRGARVGIELNTYGLTAANYELVRRALAGRCELVDASPVVRRLRLVKSPAELAYVRRAAELADDALAVMIEAAQPARLRATSPPPARARSTAAAATCRRPGPSSPPERAPCWCATPPAPPTSARTTSSRWSSAAAFAATAPASCAPSPSAETTRAGAACST